MSKRGSQRAIRLGGKSWGFGKAGRRSKGKGWAAVKLEKERKKSEENASRPQKKKSPVADSDFAMTLKAALGSKMPKKKR